MNPETLTVVIASLVPIAMLGAAALVEHNMRRQAEDAAKHWHSEFNNVCLCCEKMALDIAKTEAELVELRNKNHEN